MCVCVWGGGGGGGGIISVPVQLTVCNNAVAIILTTTKY